MARWRGWKAQRAEAAAFIPPIPSNPPPCLEDRCSFWGRLFFVWLNGIVATGYKRALTDNDIPTVPKSVSGEVLINELEVEWQKEQLLQHAYERERQEVAARKKADKARAASAIAAATVSPAAPWYVRWCQLMADRCRQLCNRKADPYAIHSPRPSLGRALVRAYRSRFLAGSTCQLLIVSLQFAQPLLLKALVANIVSSQEAHARGGLEADSEAPNRNEAWIYCCFMFLTPFIISILNNRYQRIMQCMGIQLRACMSVALYQKSLRLSNAARSSLNTGVIVNLMSVDAARLDQLTQWLQMVWSAPLQIVVSIALLLLNLGPSALAGIAIIFLLLPFNHWVIKRLRMFRRLAMGCSDQRVKFMTEILLGIKVIKMYAWESSFMSALSAIRLSEVGFQRSSALTRCLMQIVMQCGPLTMSLLAFITLGASGGELRAADVFSSLVLFNQLRLPLMMFPNVVGSIADVQVSLARLQVLLLAEEMDTAPTIDRNAEHAIHVADATFVWHTAHHLAKQIDKLALRGGRGRERGRGRGRGNGRGRGGRAGATFASSQPEEADMEFSSRGGGRGRARGRGRGMRHRDHNSDRLPPSVVQPPVEQPSALSTSPSPSPSPSSSPEPSVASPSSASSPVAGVLSLEEANPPEPDPSAAADLASSEDNRSRPAVLSPIGGGLGQECTDANFRTIATSIFDEDNDVDVEERIRRDACPPIVWHDGTGTRRLDDTPNQSQSRRWTCRVRTSMKRMGESMEELYSNARQHASKLKSKVREKFRRKKDDEESDDDGEENSQATFKLTNISLTLPKGSLTAIVGAVGQGKSSLLCGILGEMKRTSGSVTLNGSIGYCPQQPWIQHCSLRDNVLFGLPYDEERYKRAIKAAALTRDLQILPNGDATEIGEKGINLSGGQKARCSLARALYFDSDICLLDDPLSAVDAHVSAFLFSELICGAMAGKTRVLVTHSLHYLSSPHVDQIVLMHGGRIQEQGSFAELMSKDGHFAKLMREHGGEKAKSEEGDNNEDNNDVDQQVDDGESVPSPDAGSVKPVAISDGAVQDPSIISISKSNGMNGVDPATGSNVESSKSKVKTGGVVGLMEKEERVKGGLKWSTWLYYLKAIGGAPAVCGLAFCFIAQTSNNILTNTWLAWWSSEYFGPRSAVWYVSIYAGIGVAQFAWAAGATTQAAFYGTKAAIVLHDRAFTNLLRAPISFFESTPVGRVLNRFSRDQDTIDTSLMQSVQMMSYQGVSVAGSLMMIGVTSPYFFIGLLPVIIVYIYTQNYFRPTSRELKRLDSISRSPVYAHFSETLTGLSTIRAYSQQHAFMNQNLRRLDDQSRFYFALQCSSRWLAMRLEMLGACIVLLAAVVLTLEQDSIPASIVGLALSYALQVTQQLMFLVRQSVEAENNMNSVERSRFYTEQLPQEADAHLKGDDYVVPLLPPPSDNKSDQTIVSASEVNPFDFDSSSNPFSHSHLTNATLSLPPSSSSPSSSSSSSWPSHGRISVRHLDFRYRPHLPLVIHDLTIDIRGGERIGIVGRTGAGKSSFLLALLRLVEPCGGEILIDGVSTSSLGLHKLRSSFAIIPQDPVLFTGTLRFNVDPFHTSTDHQIWDALHKSNLRGMMDRLPDKLDTKVGENGDNFSVGEKSQLCLARALLRCSKILLLDEATASLDLQTDAIIQQSLREHFRATTIITIAHRLVTIADYDRVLVLESGRVVEFDSPFNLLSKPESDPSAVFRSMVEQTGEVTAKLIRDIAATRANEEQQQQQVTQSG